jgi:hypothetical protein
MVVVMASDCDENAAPDVVLYTRDGCHLCDEAIEVLLQHHLAPKLVDVDADLSLQQRYGECVPVVEIDGKIRFQGRVEPVLLRRILERHG